MCRRYTCGCGLNVCQVCARKAEDSFGSEFSPSTMEAGDRIRSSGLSCKCV